jgi:hypothetical protein
MWAIEKARREKQSEAMKEYDDTVYRPAKNALQDECAAKGHTPNGRWRTMVSGRGYQHCGSCGVTLYEEEIATPGSRAADKGSKFP